MAGRQPQLRYRICFFTSCDTADQAVTTGTLALCLVEREELAQEVTSSET